MSISNEISKTLKVASQNAEAACRNEQLTRERVESLERILGGFFSLPLKARLRWVLFGFPPVIQNRPAVKDSNLGQAVSKVAEPVSDSLPDDIMVSEKTNVH